MKELTIEEKKWMLFWAGYMIVDVNNMTDDQINEVYEKEFGNN